MQENSPISMKKIIAIDPSSQHYYEDRLFDASNAVLNRDDTLAPLIRMKEKAESAGMEIHTADYLWSRQGKLYSECDYFSLGVLRDFKRLASQKDMHLKAFMIMEPPVVAPKLYKALPAITSVFERVYVHNTIGDGYSMDGVDQSKLCKLYWPQPRMGVIESLWQKGNRQHRVVIINGNHKPKSKKNELYSKRIEVMNELSQLGAIDLYGRGWERWWMPASQWWPYWSNRQALMSIYKGACSSKYEVMSKYTFALCFENMAMHGYVTEKIFDCFYAGTIPIYLGAPDIAALIPEESFIDYRKFSSSEELWRHISELSEKKINEMRVAGREYLNSKEFLNYYNSMENVLLSSEG